MSHLNGTRSNKQLSKESNTCSDSNHDITSKGHSDLWRLIVALAQESIKYLDTLIQ